MYARAGYLSMRFSTSLHNTGRGLRKTLVQAQKYCGCEQFALHPPRRLASAFDHGDNPEYVNQLNYGQQSRKLPNVKDSEQASEENCDEIEVITIKTPPVVIVTKDQIGTLKRKELQMICRAFGVNQGQKNTILVENIIKYMEVTGIEELKFHSFDNPGKLEFIAEHRQDHYLSIELHNNIFKGFGRIYQGIFPSVTTVLNITKPENSVSNLQRWERKEILKSGKENFDAMVEASMNNGAYLHKVVAEWLKDFHEWNKNDEETFKNDLKILQTGETRQSQREDYFRNKLNSVKNGTDSENTLLHNQLHSLLPVLSKIEKVLAVESGVIHQLLGYAGTVDSVVVYDGQICVIDWKTSKRKKKTLKSCYDYPIQLAAYAGAINEDLMYPFTVKNAAIVFAYDDGSPADVHFMSRDLCEQYWGTWQGRLQLYMQLFDVKSLDESAHLEEFEDGGWDKQITEEESEHSDETKYFKKDALCGDIGGILKCHMKEARSSGKNVLADAIQYDAVVVDDVTSSNIHHKVVSTVKDEDLVISKPNRAHDQRNLHAETGNDYVSKPLANKRMISTKASLESEGAENDDQPSYKDRDLVDRTCFETDFVPVLSHNEDSAAFQNTSNSYIYPGNPSNSVQAIEIDDSSNNSITIEKHDLNIECSESFSNPLKNFDSSIEYVENSFTACDYTEKAYKISEKEVFSSTKNAKKDIQRQRLDKVGSDRDISHSQINAQSKKRRNVTVALSGPKTKSNESDLMQNVCKGQELQGASASNADFQPNMAMFDSEYHGIVISDSLLHRLSVADFSIWCLKMTVDSFIRYLKSL